MALNGRPLDAFPGLSSSRRIDGRSALSLVVWNSGLKKKSSCAPNERLFSL